MTTYMVLMGIAPIWISGKKSSGEDKPSRRAMLMLWNRA